MFIWTGLVFDILDEEYIRNICKEINKEYKLSEVAFTLPQHISLKTSFYTENYIEVINYIKDILSNNLNLSINILGISKINGGIIWFDVEENEKLRNIHNLLNHELLNMFNIPLIKFDGNNFKFHSTLFQDINISDKHSEMIDKLNDNFNFPIKMKINKINIGISQNGIPGSFKVIDEIKLSNEALKL